MKLLPITMCISATLFLSSCLEDLRNSLVDDTTTDVSTSTLSTTDTSTQTSTDMTTDTHTQICAALASQVIFSYQIVENNVVKFDASSSYIADCSNAVLFDTYNWDFGNGTQIQTNSPITTVQFDDASVSYLVTLSHESGISYSATIQPQLEDSVSDLECAQTTSIIQSQNESVITLSAQLESNCENTSLGFSWDLGDSNFADGQSITHEYNQGGQYNVMLTVEANEGIATHQSAVFVPVIDSCSQELRNLPPISAFQFSANSTVLTFEANSTTDCDEVLNYLWDFGDGNTHITDSETISHTYSGAGTYVVSLKTISSSGEFNISTQTITVNELTYEIKYESLFPGSDEVSFYIDIPQYENSELIFDWYTTGGHAGTQAEFNVLFQNVGTYIVVGSVYGPNGFNLRLELNYDVSITFCSYAPIAAPQLPVLNTLVTDLTVELSINSLTSECHNPFIGVDFGDGSEIVENNDPSASESFTHVYEQAGQYTIQVMTEAGVVDAVVEVTEPLVCVPNDTAYFTVEMLNAHDFKFEATYGVGCLNHFSWDFGDGTTLSTNEGTVEHHFEELGEYNVMLSRGGEQHYVAKVVVTDELSSSEYITLDFNYGVDDQSTLSMYVIASIQEFNNMIPPIDIDPYIYENEALAIDESEPLSELVLIVPPLNNYEFNYSINTGEGMTYASYPYSAYGYSISHEYVAGGTYPINISASNYLGQMISVDLDMYIRHEDKILSDVTSSVVGGQVFLNAETSFNFDEEIAVAVQYSWDLGDGTIYSGLNLNQLQHVYSEVGQYDITVTMQTEYKSLELVKTLSVDIIDLDVPIIIVH
ncbi:PKD domain-containing protein [Marinicellulosiphila megalodicopiae]|uniref:PKD domain-containing protein n=1 Tax=Marinicellulosiphila megalodicopiae TaxID=2724896 RepID=UPI003BAE415B